MTPSTTHLKRRQVDRKLIYLQSLHKVKPPTGGWLRAIRESLGMTSSQAGNRAGVSQQNWTKAENSESRGSISLSTLGRMSEALECRLVYAIVPNDGSLEDLLMHRARAVAAKVMARTHATMKLEDQEVSEPERAQQTEELAKQIANELKSSLWEG